MNRKGFQRSDALNDVDDMPSLQLSKGVGRVEDKMPKKNFVIEEIQINGMRGGAPTPSSFGNQPQYQNQQHQQPYGATGGANQWGNQQHQNSFGNHNQQHADPYLQQNNNMNMGNMNMNMNNNNNMNMGMGMNMGMNNNNMNMGMGMNNNKNNMNMGIGMNNNNMNMGMGMNMGIGGGAQAIRDPVINAICTRVQNKYLAREIKTIADFFTQYDAYESRDFELWELEIICENGVQFEEIRRFVDKNGKNQGFGVRVIPYAQLAGMVQVQAGLPIGAAPLQSLFKTKNTPPAILSHLSNLAITFSQGGTRLDMFYDQNFRLKYVDQGEFQGFMGKIGVMGIQSYELMQIYQYFILPRETMISKISLIQGIKSLMQGGPPNIGSGIEAGISRNNIPVFNQGHGGPISMTTFHTATSFESMNTSGFAQIGQVENPLMQQFISQARHWMSVNGGLSFEDLLRRFGIPNTMYIETSKFEEICFRIELRLQTHEMKQVMSMLDQDRNGKVKTQYLRQKLEQQGLSGLAGGRSNNNFHLELDSQLLNNQISPLVSPLGMYPNNNNFRQQPPPVLDNPISFGPGQQQQHYQQNVPINNNNIYNNYGAAGPQHDIKPILDRINMFLAQIQITNLSKVFSISYLYNKQVIELQEFLNFLQSPGFQINQQQAYMVAHECQIVMTSNMNYQTQQFVDLEKFEKILFAGNQNHMNLSIQKNNSYMSMNKVYDAIRKYIMINGGDISKFFQEADINKDNFIQKAELKIAFEKIGYYNITDQEIDNIYWNFDQNQDGRISYSELCQQFSEFSNTKAIKDPSHWAYYIFENIRRTCSSTQRPIADLFGLTGLNITNLQQKFPITKQNFFMAFSKLNIPLTQEYERKLLELLDADHSGQSTIDFIHFCELVGMNYQPFQLQQITNDYLQNPVAVAQNEKIRQFFRSLFDVIQAKNISINNLKMIFMSCDLGGQQSITFDDFIAKLREIDTHRRIDFDSAKDACAKFSTQQAYHPRVDYMKFLGKLTFEIEKYKVINLIFLTLQVAMSKTMKSNLYELFSQYDPQGMRTFDKELLAKVLIVLGLNLKQYEIDMVIIEYDPKGTGMKLDFTLFQKDFEDFKTGSSPLNSFVKKQNLQYLDFQNYSNSYNAQPNNLAVHNIGRQPTTLVLTILNKVGRFLDANPQYSLNNQLLNVGITKLGILNRTSFKQLLDATMMLNREDSSHLLQHYDPMNRDEVRIAEFLVDIKDQVQSPQMKVAIVDLAQLYNFTQVQAQGGVGHNMAGSGAVSQILQKYTKDFEEIQKAILIQNMNTFTYFHNFSHNAPYINKEGFRTAMQRLQLSHLAPLDIETIFEAIDTMHKGIIQIDNLDQAIRQTSRLSLDQMYEEILQKIVEAFNGDDTFLLQQLMDLDRSKTGQVELSSFEDYFVRNCPRGTQMNRIDLKFLGMKYCNPRTLNPTSVDINIFLKEFNNVRKQRGIISGDYSSMHRMNDQYGGGPGFGGSFGEKTRNGMMNSGHRNSFLPGITKTNTLAEQNHIVKPHNFNIGIDSNYLEELMRATYLAEKTVYEYFNEYSQKMNGGLIQEGDFTRAIQSLNITWTVQTTSVVFQHIDQAFNNYQQRRQITAEQVDQAVCFGSRKTIDQMQSEYMTAIAHQASRSGFNLRNEIQRIDDGGRTSQIRIEQFRRIILDVIRVPSLIDHDVNFLCKKYIINVPNVVQYKQFLDDYETIIKLQFSNTGNSQQMCEYIKKFLFIQNKTIKECFGKSNRNRGALSQADFAGILSDMGIIPQIFEARAADQLYQEINTRNSEMIIIQDIETFVLNMAAKQLKDLQDDVIDEMISKSQGRNIIVDGIFSKDDPIKKGVMAVSTFAIVLHRELFTNKIDAQLIALRYQDRDSNVNYQTFLKDFKTRQSGLKSSLIGNPQGQDFGYQKKLGVGMESNTMSNPTKTRLKDILMKMQDHIQKRGIQLISLLGQHERGQASGAIPFDLFNQTLIQLGLPIPSNDIMFVGDNYIQPGGNRNQQFVDYITFLSDLKKYGKTVNEIKKNLTREQADIYKNFGIYIRKKGFANKIADDLLALDITQRFFLSKIQIDEIFKKYHFDFSIKQQALIFMPVENDYGMVNYKEMLELLLGEDAANSLFAGGLINTGIGHSRGNTQVVQFVMPSQPIGAANSLMDQIGRRLVASNINYEEEFRKRIGIQQSQGPSPKVTEIDILDCLEKCRVQITPDERIELKQFVTNKQDYMGLISVIEFLQAVGLPAQTLGSRGQKNLPRRILNKQELKTAQDLVNVIRKEIQQSGKRVQDVFDPWKQQHGDVALPVYKFKLALATVNQKVGSFTEQQIELLTYYLAQEVPNEISYKKLYLACTMTSTDQPLKQEGAEEIQKYEKKITDKLKHGTPIEILDLKLFMNQYKLSMQDIFKQTQRGEIQRQVFETALKNAGYKAKDMQKLIEILDVRTGRNFVSLDKLSAYLSKTTAVDESRNITPQIARERYQHFDAKVRFQLQKISDYLKRKNQTIQKMFEEMDVNRDGTLDKQEFVTKMAYMGIPCIVPSDCGLIFDAIDVNNDGLLSYNEFGMFIEGAKATRQQRTQELDPSLIESMRRDIKDLFHQFDENHDGRVTADEIVKAMMALGNRVTLDEAANMIAQIDQNGDKALDENEFISLMLPKMKEELLSQEDSLEDLRSLFLDADVDHSGTLSVDEIYGVIQKLGADVTLEDLVELMNEIDVNRDGELDIDEFIALMNMGDELQFRSAMSKNTFMNIKRARKLNPLDFFKNFKNMPGNFVPSFFTEKWVKFKKNLPSSVFIPQIDPATMLYKDLYPVMQQNLNPNQMQLQFQPRVRPLITEIGCQILMEEATGVPLPAQGSGFDAKTQIVKRVVRVGLYDTVKKDFIVNAVQVNALYNQVDEDVWKFNSWGDNGTNPVLFKTANRDEFIKPHIFIIFELVTVIKIAEKVTEMSCGWCQLDSTVLDKGLKHKLPIKGGSPSAVMMIKDQDVHTNRTGMKYIIGKLQSKILSQLTVQIRPHQKFSDETKLHLDLLPTTCFIQKRLLYFVSGFRNYLGEKFLKPSQMNQFKQPEGDVIVSCFPRILDNPDICELIISIWSEDVWKSLNDKQKSNIELLMLKTKEYIQKLYPVIYAEEFKFKESDYTMSAAGDQYLLRKREELIKAALCYGNKESKTRVDKPLEAITTFRPFTVRELEFEVWDTKSAKQDRYMRQYEEIGLISKFGNQTNIIMSPQQQLAGYGQQQFGPIGQQQFGVGGGGLQIDTNIMAQNQYGGNMISPQNMFQQQQQQQQQQYGQGSLMGAAINHFK